MVRQQERCPGCEADVHPKAVECPECGRELKPRGSLLPLIAGGVGVVIALAAGAGVWVLLDPGERPRAEAPAAPPAPVASPPPQASAPAPQASAPAPQAAAPAAPPEAAAPQGVADSQLPLPGASPGALPAADEAARKEFARATEENFVKNGLNMKVTTGGPNATTLTIAFSFPAKMAVELISGGPFPRQCRQRGFTSILFTDSGGASWAYDIATDKLTAK